MKVKLVTDLYRKISIKTKLTFIALLFIVYPIVIIGYFGYRNYADTMKEKAVKSVQSTARDLTNLLSDRMTKLSLFSVQILYDNTIYNANRDLTAGSMDYIAENQFTAYLQSNLFLKSELNEILIRFSRNSKVFQVNKSMGSTTESYTLMDALYNAAQTGKGRPVWYVSYNNNAAAGIYIAKIIYDINDIKREIGLLVFKVSDRYLSEVLFNYTANPGQDIILLDGNREVFSYKPFALQLGKPLDSLIAPGPDSGSRVVRTGSDTVYLLYDTIRPDSWKLVLGISSNLLLKDVRDIARLILILCIATLPICLLLVNFLYMDMIKPLNLLIRGMRQVEKGDFGTVIESRRADEFGYVYTTFNKMSLEIRNLINTVYKKQIATKDAEIKALQAQINPHFLYNTLDSINWKAKIHGVPEISEMVSALSSIIEANLNRNNETLIPLGREIEYINNYYLLLQKRFGKKIRLELDIQEDTLDCIIPKLIIQPLVENAVHHGLERKVGSGSVRLEICREQDRLLIAVRDDGIGIEAATLDRLRQSLDRALEPEEDSPEPVSASIGILNVHKRIRLIYGDEFGLQISSRAEEGTSVEIRLPALLQEGAVRP